MPMPCPLRVGPQGIDWITRQGRAGCSLHRLARGERPPGGGIGSGAATHSPVQLFRKIALPLRYSLVRQGVAATGAADGSCPFPFPSLRLGIGGGAMGFSVGTIETPAAALEACFSISACFAAISAFAFFSISACFAIMAACICFSISACFATMAACIFFAMAAFIAPACFAMAACICVAMAACIAPAMAERTEHDPSRHGLASAGVELAAERPSVATVAQARRKARFVGMGCLHCDLRTLGKPPPPQCDSKHNMCFFSLRAAPHAGARIIEKTWPAED